MLDRILILVPILIYLALTLYIASRDRYRVQKETNAFIEEYFLGSRSMGGLALAMTIVTTYTSASSFIGGPGIAYTLGFGWVLLAMIQVPTTFLTLGVLGKRFAILGRKTRSVTVVDFLFARYRNNTIVLLCSLAMIVFFMASMLAQFIGGARVFQAVTGYSYETGLLLFGVSVVLYTSVGGFRAITVTAPCRHCNDGSHRRDACCRSACRRRPGKKRPDA